MYLLPVVVYGLALGGAFAEDGAAFLPALFAAIALCSAEVGWQLARAFRKMPDTLR
jgi:hypothetical protein